MDVGMMMVFASYGWENCPDDRVWDEEIRLAGLAADLGFDCLWSAEHHFNDYSFVPDNLHLMTYLTARHPGIDVGTAAVILPWHDPLRVAENAAVLDMLSKGRLRLGMGRGLARREFAAFRLSMDESRGRFDEAAPMIVEALRTGFIEGDGVRLAEAFNRANQVAGRGNRTRRADCQNVEDVGERRPGVCCGQGNIAGASERYAVRGRSIEAGGQNKLANGLVEEH